jgi:hypothetical protein
MRKLVRVAALVLPLSLLVPLSSRAHIPQAQAAAAVETAVLVVIPTPAVELANRSLADEIFKAGLPNGGIAVVSVGRCSQSCAPCLGYCPPDDDGRHQSCLPYCP